MLGQRWLRIAFVLVGCLALSVLGEECSKDKPCATGCCSQHGFCGTTPDHCGEGCLANCDFKLDCDANNPCEVGCCSKFGFWCDRKGECDPGWGSDWSEDSNCPLNVCCSDFGSCGTTEEFCGNTTVKHQMCSKDGYMTRVVGYYEGWASRRPCHDFWPEQIPVGVYSHINFAFATIDPETYEVGPSDKRDDVKIMIALGGWTFNDPGPTATVFSDLAASEEKQKKFFKSLISFMSTHGFDGVNLDWEYPRSDDRSGRPEDFKNFPKFMRNLKDTLRQTPGRNELSITLPASYWYLQHFDLVNLNEHIDFYNIMTYDMHGTWDQGNKWTGSFLNAHTNITEIKDSLDLLWRNDVDPAHVVLGVAFYGRAYTVKGCTEPGCVYASGSVLLNNEIMDIMNERDLKSKLYKDVAVKVVTWDDQWVSYDDRETFKMKAELARSQCLSGLMVWAISHDTPTADFSKDLAAIANRKVYLQRAEQDEEDVTEEIENHDQCHWTNCGIGCPNG
ncbi:glycoside hydrolase superfamily [Aspergillus venezuelensis]